VRLKNLEENSENKAPESEQIPEGEGNTSTSEKKGMSTPGFEIVYSVICLFGVFLYRRWKI